MPTATAPLTSDTAKEEVQGCVRRRPVPKEIGGQSQKLSAGSGT